jgi:tetratricopeptide (TPR) repeat protein
MPPSMAHTALIRVLRRNLKRSLGQRQIGAAEALLAQLEAEDPLSVETRGSRLEVLMATQRWPEAQVLAEQLLQLFPSSARIHYLAARLFYFQKHYALALQHFTEADRLHPHWSLTRWRGKTQTQRGDYEAAEALLVGLVREHPEVGRDLAWLYERRGEPERALFCLEEYLAVRPGDSSAQAQRLRLRATAAAPEDLLQEVEELHELGEEIAPEMLPTYIQRLLETGRAADARRVVDERLAQWAPETAARVAWVCHRLQAYDLSLRLFLAGLPSHHRDYKYLSALESAARHCRRSDEVARAYRALAAHNPALHGRIRTLERRTS